MKKSIRMIIHNLPLTFNLITVLICFQPVANHDGDGMAWTFCDRDTIKFDIGSSGTINGPDGNKINTTKSCQLVIANSRNVAMMVELKLSPGYKFVINQSKQKPDITIVVAADAGDESSEGSTVKYSSDEIFQVLVYAEKNMRKFTLEYGAYPVFIVKQTKKAWSIADNQIAYLSSTMGFISQNPELDEQKLDMNLGNYTCGGNVSLTNFPLTSTKVKIKIDVEMGQSTNCVNQSGLDTHSGKSQLTLTVKSYLDSFREIDYTCNGSTVDVSEIDVTGSPTEVLHISYQVHNLRPGYGFTLRYELQKCDYDAHIYDVKVVDEDNYAFNISCKTGAPTSAIRSCLINTWDSRLPDCNTVSNTGRDQESVASTVIILGSVTGVLAAFLIGLVIFIVVMKVRCSQQQAAQRAREAEEAMRRAHRVGVDNPVIQNGDVIEVYTPLEVYHVNSQDKVEELKAG